MAKLFLSVAETAELLGVSDDLVYELTMQGSLPRIQFGRRKLIPRRAIETIIESVMDAFNARSSIRPLSQPKTAQDHDEPPRQLPEAGSAGLTR